MPLENALGLAQLKDRPVVIKGEIIFVLGGPGSGKRTHCARLAEAKGYIHISASELIHNILIDAPATPDEMPEITAIRAAVQRKELLDDQMIIDLVKFEMTNYPRATGFLIDGCPRNLTQLALFEKQIKPCSKVFYFKTTEENMMRRVLHRGNQDDSEASVRKSINVYKNTTHPVVEHLKQTKQSIFHQVNSSKPLNEVYTEVEGLVQLSPIAEVSYFEFLKLYFKLGNFYDTVDELQKKYGGASDFHVTMSYLFSTMTMFYIIQNREDVKRVLSANTRTGYQNHNFEVAAGHTLNINGVQAWNGTADEKNPIWEEIHKGLAASTATREEVTALFNKHLPKFLAKKQFALDVEFERFMLDFWCEYMFGPKINSAEYCAMRGKMLAALSYAYYGNKAKSLPYLGNLTCRLYGYYKKEEFKEVDAILQRFIDQSDGGLIYRFREKLMNSTFPRDQITQAVLDNAFDFVLVFDFIHNAIYETLAEIVRRDIDSGPQRRRTYNQGLANSFLFPYRVRIPQAPLVLQQTTVAGHVPIYINLCRSGLHNSFGPRACIGTAVSDWIKEAVWSHLDNVELRLVKTSLPEERVRLSHNRDVPFSPERYEVTWRRIEPKKSSRLYPRNYLQTILPHYEFKGVNAFYDVLKTYENVKMRDFIVNNILEAIRKLKLDLKNVSIVVPEMRGIALGACIAERLDVSLVHIRKKGNIPGPVASKDYKYVYSSGCLELSKESAIKNRDVILIDDGIASGGTTLACCELIEQQGGRVKLVAAMIDHVSVEKPEGLKKYNVHTTFDFQSVTPGLTLRP